MHSTANVRPYTPRRPRRVNWRKVAEYVVLDLHPGVPAAIAGLSLRGLRAELRKPSSRLRVHLRTITEEEARERPKYDPEVAAMLHGLTGGDRTPAFDRALVHWLERGLLDSVEAALDRAIEGERREALGLPNLSHAPRAPHETLH